MPSLCRPVGPWGMGGGRLPGPAGPGQDRSALRACERPRHPAQNVQPLRISGTGLSDGVQRSCAPYDCGHHPSRVPAILGITGNRRRRPADPIGRVWACWWGGGSFFSAKCGHGTARPLSRDAGRPRSSAKENPRTPVRGLARLGRGGFEPPTPAFSVRCSTELSYLPVGHSRWKNAIPSRSNHYLYPPDLILSTPSVDKTQEHEQRPPTAPGGGRDAVMGLSRRHRETLLSCCSSRDRAKSNLVKVLLDRPWFVAVTYNVYLETLEGRHDGCVRTS